METQHGRVRPGEERRARQGGLKVYGIPRDQALRNIECAVLDYWMGHGHTVLQLTAPSAESAAATQCPCCLRSSPPLERWPK